METNTVEIKYHQVIDNLPLSNFIDCMVDGNLSALIISGFPPEEDLKKAWEHIKAEYAERIGQHEYKLYVSMYKEISQLRITLDQIDLITAREDKEKGIKPGILRLCYDEFFAGEINKILRRNCKFNWKDQKSYMAELDKCYTMRGGYKIRYDLLNLRFEAIEAKQKAEPGEPITRAYFTSILVTLSDYQAKHSLSDNIKMGEYCERLKRWNSLSTTLKR